MNINAHVWKAIISNQEMQPTMETVIHAKTSCQDAQHAQTSIDVMLVRLERCSIKIFQAALTVFQIASRAKRWYSKARLFDTVVSVAMGIRASRMEPVKLVRLDAWIVKRICVWSVLKMEFYNLMELVEMRLRIVRSNLSFIQ